MDKRLDKLNLLLTKKLMKKTVKFLEYHLHKQELLADVLALTTSSYLTALFLMLKEITKESSEDVKESVENLEREFQKILALGFGRKNEKVS